MTKTVIFDLDGLMIDSEKISYELYRDFLELYGHPFSIGEYAQGYSGHTGVENMVSLIETYRLPIGTEEGLQWVNKREEMYMDRGVALSRVLEIARTIPRPPARRYSSSSLTQIGRAHV